MKNLNVLLNLVLRTLLVGVGVVWLFFPTNGMAQNAQPSAGEKLARQCPEILATLPLRFNPAALRRAIQDLAATCPARYTRRDEFLAKLDKFEKGLPGLRAQLTGSDAAGMEAGLKTWNEMLAFQREALLANPLLDFDQLLLIRHAIAELPMLQDAHIPGSFGYYLADKLNLSANWICDFLGAPVAQTWNDEVCKISIHQPDQPYATVFKPKPGYDLQHLELDYDGEKILFSMAGTNGCWQVHEVKVDGTGLRQVTPGVEPAVDNGDACYLPDGRIIFNSNRAMIGVPCQDGVSYAAGLCLMNADGSGQRLLTFDQDSDFHPSVLNNGRIIYLRYEYANVSHQFPGLLFHMNPDGTGQMEYYGSQSYWPNRIFHPRAIPGHPTMVAGIVAAHHGPHKMGKLMLFDPARGRFQADGVVQAIPGYGQKVEPVVVDMLYANDWPKFMHPYPLSEKYFLVSGWIAPGSVFSIWLVDVFDNMTLIKEIPGNALFDPIPLKKTPRPPVVSDKIKPGEKSATVSLQNVYRGYSMRGVPGGLVKKLRVFSYNYVYRNRDKDGFGHLATPGVDGPWEPRYLLGTVPVETDGSAFFKVPANTPIAVQPLDAEGRALQLMRSWFTGMPGENISCVGCHDQQNNAPPNRDALALRRAPSEIEPWQGPARGFDFEREIQPVLDKKCVGCHNAEKPNGADLSRKTPEEQRAISRKFTEVNRNPGITTLFTPSYLALQSHVYRPSAESNYRPQVALEFFAEVSPLIRMLKKGHYNVKLDSESWERLYTWIDLAAPAHGTWSRNSVNSIPENGYLRRQEIYKTYAGLDYEYETLPPEANTPVVFVAPVALPAPANPPACQDWPFDDATAKKKQAAAGLPLTRAVELGNGKKLDFVLMPAGEFIMGDPAGPDDERSVSLVKIDKPFYMSVREISNVEFTAIRPNHNSGRIGFVIIDSKGDGYSVNEPSLPAVRVSWRDAVSFCKALSETTGQTISLPTESQWEWACRAGTGTAMWYGETSTVFSAFENLADASLAGLAPWFPRDDRSNDNGMITVACGSYKPNPWGLFDMHGNVSEWTLTEYRPYPYSDSDGRNSATDTGLKVVRGGSWMDLPRLAPSSYRWRYQAFEEVYNVGFRVVMKADK